MAPDVEVQDSEIADITRVLLQKSYLFDYATRYRAEHATIPPARDFQALRCPSTRSSFSSCRARTSATARMLEKSSHRAKQEGKEEKHYDDVKAEIEAIRQKVIDQQEPTT